MEQINKCKRKVIKAIAKLNDRDFNTIVFFLMGDVRESADAAEVLRKMRRSFL